MFDFSQNTVVDSIEAVPQDFRPFYGEGEDGKFKLLSDNPAVKSAVAVITGLGSSLTKSRAEAKELAKATKVDLSSLSDYGTDPESIAAGFSAKLDEVTKGGKNDRAAIREEVAKELAADHTTKLAAKDTAFQNLQNQFFSQMGESVAKSSLADQNAIVDLALPFVTQQLKLQGSDKGYTVVVVGENGEPRHSGTTGELLTVPELITEMKTNEKFAPLFKSEAPSGGGSKPNAGTAPAKGEALSSVDKISAGLGSLGKK